MAGVALLAVALLRVETLLLGSAVGRLRLGGAIGLLLGREALGGGETLLLGAAGAALLRAAAGGQAVAGHFLLAQLRDDGGRHHFGDDVELAVFQVVVDDEAHERLAVHGKAVFLRLGGQVGFGFTGERGVVAEQALVVVGVHEHGVEGGGVLTSRAHHLFALHGLFGFLGYLNGRDGRVEDLVGGAFYPVFHASFKPRENAHQYSLYVVEIREVIPIQPAILPQMGLYQGLFIQSPRKSSRWRRRVGERRAEALLARCGCAKGAICAGGIRDRGATRAGAALRRFRLRVSSLRRSRAPGLQLRGRLGRKARVS